MAEALGIAAAILQISGAGAKLAMTLHKLGVEVASAGIQLNGIAKGISLFSQMLKQVGQTLRQEDSVHSPGALETTQEIVEQCRSIYNEIQKMVDSVQRRDSNGFVKPINVAERVRFCFKKTKIEFLLGELESLKMTLSTIIQVLYTGRLMLMFQQLQDLGNAQKAEKDIKKEEIEQERSEVQSLVITRHYALVRLSQLHAQVVQEEENGSRSIEGAGSLDSAQQVAKLPAQPKSVENRLVIFTEKSLGALDASLSSASDKPSELMRRSHNFVDYLLDRWTIIREITTGDTRWNEARREALFSGNQSSVKQKRRTSTMSSKQGNYRPTTYSTDDETDIDESGRSMNYDIKPNGQATSTQQENREVALEPRNIQWWRGSNRDTRRTFEGKQLKSFKVISSAWDRVNAASFPKDEWTDVPDSWISEDALKAWNYQSSSYEKKTGQKIRDRNELGEPQGRDGEPMTELVHRIKRPLTYTEIEDLVELSAAIRKRRSLGINSIPSSLVPRRPPSVDDMPYPDAPFGKLGYVFENFLKEGKQASPDNINVLGSLIESKLSKKYSPELIRTLKPMFINKTKDAEEDRSRQRTRTRSRQYSSDSDEPY